MVIGAAGAAVALWCIFTFAVVGRGTPAPFDPPRRLLILACAVGGEAHLITTEDSDLRALGDEYEGVLVLSWVSSVNTYVSVDCWPKASPRPIKPSTSG